MSSERRTLTQDQVDSFWRNGWLVVEDLLSPDDVARLGQRADQIARGETDASPERVQAERSFAKAKPRPPPASSKSASSTGWPARTTSCKDTPAIPPSLTSSPTCSTPMTSSSTPTSSS